MLSNLDLPGKLIVLEGIDGSGKTSQIEPTMQMLRAHGFDAVTFREPGGTEAGEMIRSILLGTPLDPLTEIMLFASQRVEIIKKQIIPALAEGKVVLMDRFLDSSFAYQGFANGCVHEVETIENALYKDFQPDYTLYFNVRVEVAMDRMKSNNRKLDIIEKRGQEYQRRIKSGYHLRLSKRHARDETVIYVDAEKTQEQMTYQIAEFIDHVFFPVNKELVKGANK